MSILRAGVIGWPIEHSKSPVMHGYWLKQLGIAGEYVKIAAAPDEFVAAVRGLARNGWQGMNVTIPHKEAALKLADKASDTAQAIGAANTLVFQDDGKIRADNTDGYGFTENLIDRAGANWRSDEPAVIYGAGGAARAIIHALLGAGAAEVRLLNRTKSRAEDLARAFGPKVKPIDWGNDAMAMSGAGLIVNTTSLGMVGQPALQIDFSVAPSHAVVTDIVYTPLVTPFLQDASGAGLTTVDGLGMLIHQGRSGFEAWFGQMPSADVTLRELLLNS